MDRIKKIIGYCNKIILMTLLSFCLKAQPPKSEIHNSWNDYDSVMICRWISDAMTMSTHNQDSSIIIIKHRIEQSQAHAYGKGIYTGSLLLGILYIYRGEYTTAIEWLEMALKHADKTDEVVSNLCRVLNNLGNAYHFQGNYKQAAEYYFYGIRAGEDAISGGKKSKGDADTLIANPLTRLYISAANTLLEMGDYKRALYYLDKSERFVKEKIYTKNLPGVYINKAILYSKTGAIEKARLYNKEGLLLAGSMKMEEMRHIALHNEGDIALAENKPFIARAIYKQALTIKGNVNPYYRSGTMISIANTYFIQKDYNNAELYLLQAYKIAKPLKINEQLLHIHQQLANLYAITRNYTKAYKNDHAAYILNDSLLNKEKTEAVNQLEIKYRTAEKEKEIVHKELLINKQKRQLYKKNMLIIGTICSTSMLIVLLIGFYKNYHHKQRLHAEQLRTLKQETEIALLQAMMKGEEKQRVRFAQELHDGINSQLSAIRIYIGTMLNRKNKTTTTDDLEYITLMLNEASNDIRQTAHNLIPDGLMRYGLIEAARSFCEHLSKGGKLQIEFQNYGKLGGLDNELELFLYRTIQELLHNVVKHAQATHAIVLLNEQNNILGITVEDNGKGINTDLPYTDSMGLKSLENRVQALGGNMIIESIQGNGTTIYIEIPIKEH